MFYINYLDDNLLHTKCVLLKKEELIKISECLNLDFFKMLDLGDIEMAKKWLQKANAEMKSKGTVGAFTAQAKKAGGVKKGSGVKDSFIDKELKSKNPTTRKRAQFAKNMKSIAKGK
jgi:hypothetical protein